MVVVDQVEDGKKFTVSSRRQGLGFRRDTRPAPAAGLARKTFLHPHLFISQGTELQKTFNALLHPMPLPPAASLEIFYHGNKTKLMEVL